MDIRAIRRSECSWIPTWAHSPIAIPSVALFLSSDSWAPQMPTFSESPLLLLLYPLVVLAPLGYLYQRHRYVGVPFGEYSGTKPSASTQSDSEDEVKVTDDGPRISRWWYGVVIPPALSLLGQIGQVRSAVWAVLTFGAILLGAILLVPLFGLSLFLDARAIAKSKQNWNPNAFVWMMLGLGPLVPLFLGELTYLNSALMIPLALLYLYRRNQRVGLL